MSPTGSQDKKVETRLLPTRGKEEEGLSFRLVPDLVPESSIRRKGQGDKGGEKIFFRGHHSSDYFAMVLLLFPFLIGGFSYFFFRMAFWIFDLCRRRHPLLSFETCLLTLRCQSCFPWSPKMVGKKPLLNKMR